MIPERLAKGLQEVRKGACGKRPNLVGAGRFSHNKLPCIKKGKKKSDPLEGGEARPTKSRQNEQTGEKEKTKERLTSSWSIRLFAGTNKGRAQIVTQ